MKNDRDVAAAQFRAEVDAAAPEHDPLLARSPRHPGGDLPAHRAHMRTRQATTWHDAVRQHDQRAWPWRSRRGPQLWGNAACRTDFATSGGAGRRTRYAPERARDNAASMRRAAASPRALCGATGHGRAAAGGPGGQVASTAPQPTLGRRRFVSLPRLGRTCLRRTRLGEERGGAAIAVDVGVEHARLGLLGVPTGVGAQTPRRVARRRSSSKDLPFVGRHAVMEAKKFSDGPCSNMRPELNRSGPCHSSKCRLVRRRTIPAEAASFI